MEPPEKWVGSGAKGPKQRRIAVVPLSLCGTRRRLSRLLGGKRAYFPLGRSRGVGRGPEPRRIASLTAAFRGCIAARKGLGLASGRSRRTRKPARGRGHPHTTAMP
jgi:hypothetical protein